MSYTLQEACEPFATAADITCDCGDATDAEKNEVLAQATDALVLMTGGRVRGVCIETFRPRGPAGCDCACDCAANCSCTLLGGFTLPSPVALDSSGSPDISVTIDGTAFDDWVLVDGDLLMRADGRSWPSCQDVTIPDGDTGSFVVTVTHGEPVSLIARNAAVEVACLFLKRSPNRQNGIPARATTVSAQGVVVSMETLEKEIKNRSFLMPWVIRLLTVYAPNGRDNVFVYSPELDGGWRLHNVER